MQAKTQQGHHTAPWQYGDGVTDRAPNRDSGAFYGGIDTDESDENATGFAARVRREVLAE